MCVYYIHITISLCYVIFFLPWQCVGTGASPIKLAEFSTWGQHTSVRKKALAKWFWINTIPFFQAWPLRSLLNQGENSESISELMLVTQLCPTFCDPMDCNLPGSSVHGILQARILEWVAISFSRGSSLPGDCTQVSPIVGRSLTIWAQWPNPDTGIYSEAGWLWENKVTSRRLSLVMCKMGRICACKYLLCELKLMQVNKTMHLIDVVVWPWSCQFCSCCQLSCYISLCSRLAEPVADKGMS